MLRIGICDDVEDARFVLRSALERVLEARKIQSRFAEFSSGETMLRWYDCHVGELDIVFLDMELRQIDGMETARRLRSADAGLQLPYWTARKQPWCGSWIGLMCAATEIFTTVSFFRTYCTSLLTGGRFIVSRRTEPIRSTINWMRWQPRWEVASSAFISAIWFRPRPWIGWRAARLSFGIIPVCR